MAIPTRRRGRWTAVPAVMALAVTALAACSNDNAANEAAYEVTNCERADFGGRSVARVWDETTLGLIRQVIPAPTVHARNLFHVSVAMWDAWAAYDSIADGYVVTEKHESNDPAAAREVAMSYAAYRVLQWRYGVVSDLPVTEATLDDVMASLCLRTDYDDTDGDDPAALGNRIARSILDGAATDGAGEEERYLDASYLPKNEPLVVAEPGATMQDPNAWQPLSLGEQVAQNGLSIPGNVQTFIGSQWGHVAPFALASSPSGTPIDPGPPPRFGDPLSDEAFKQSAVEVIRFSSELDPDDGVMIDIAPSSLGANTLGTNDGNGYLDNPVTGEPYEPELVPRADFERAIAEFWADGPDSETPPGHWNVLANAIADSPGFSRRMGGVGPELDRLEWDVKTYFVLNGAVHDAAIAAWGLKSFYDSSRPISMIRYMAGLGQSSDPAAPSFDPGGLPLVDDLIEVVSVESSAPGERHEMLAEHVGEIALRSWRGPPDDPKNQRNGVGWIRGVEWVPYQRPSFVSPAFAAYVSGHSAFSRASAEVLTALTGSPFFPSGLAKWDVPAGTLLHEEGPSVDITLQWATYYDASDQAGISRLYGGIHIAADDLEGRRIGSECGTAAWALGRKYFDGTVRS